MRNLLFTLLMFSGLVAICQKNITISKLEKEMTQAAQAGDYAKAADYKKKIELVKTDPELEKLFAQLEMAVDNQDFDKAQEINNEINKKLDLKSSSSTTIAKQEPSGSSGDVVIDHSSSTSPSTNVWTAQKVYRSQDDILNSGVYFNGSFSSMIASSTVSAGTFTGMGLHLNFGTVKYLNDESAANVKVGINLDIIHHHIYFFTDAYSDVLPSSSIQLVNLGPQISVKLSETTALDFYGVVGPTVNMVSLTYQDDNDEIVSDRYSGYGLSIQPGIMYRSGHYSIGVSAPLTFSEKTDFNGDYSNMNTQGIDFHIGLDW